MGRASHWLGVTLGDPSGQSARIRPLIPPGKTHIDSETAGLIVLDTDRPVRHCARMGESVGTWKWALSTRGRLSLHDRAQLIGQLGLSAPLFPGEVLARLGRASNPPGLHRPAGPPKSDIVEVAERRCQDATDEHPWLYPHSLRTFRFAMLFAEANQLCPKLDREVMWVAAMLHDIALVDTDAALDPTLRCFAARSACQAEKLAKEHGWSPERRLKLADAVALHINVRVPPDQSVEGHLLNLGSGLDVAGNRYRRIDSTQLLAVLKEAPPRDDFRETIWQVWKADARRSKGCRTRFLRATGLCLLTKTSPLARLAAKEV
jgi:HD domain